MVMFSLMVSAALGMVGGWLSASVFYYFTVATKIKDLEYHRKTCLRHWHVLCNNYSHLHHKYNEVTGTKYKSLKDDTKITRSFGVEECGECVSNDKE